MGKPSQGGTNIIASVLIPEEGGRRAGEGVTVEAEARLMCLQEGGLDARKAGSL